MILGLGEVVKNVRTTLCKHNITKTYFYDFIAAYQVLST